MEKENTERRLVVVIGAGAAGIFAAQYLSKYKIDYIILEARHRTGGRCYTQFMGKSKFPVDLGAGFIHNYTQENPFHRYIEKFNINKSTSKFNKWQYKDIERGDIPPDVLKAQRKNLHNLLAHANDKSDQQPNLSLFEGLEDLYRKTQAEQDPLSNRVLEMLLNTTQQYNAANLNDLSAEYYDHEEKNRGNFIPECGYGTVLQLLSEDLRVELNTVVKQIDYNKGEFKIHTNNRTYRCKYVICTIPLGVLKKEIVKFNPGIPISHANAIKRLGMGLMNKIAVKFNRKFWGDSNGLVISSDQIGKFPRIYFSSQRVVSDCFDVKAEIRKRASQKALVKRLSSKSNTVIKDLGEMEHFGVCFVSDRFAESLEEKSDEAVIEEFLKFLSLRFGEDVFDVGCYAVTRWGKDPFSLGSYAYWHKDSSPRDCEIMRGPIYDGCFYFAGEAYYSQNIGACYGAAKIGRDAAFDLVSKKQLYNRSSKDLIKLK